MILIRLGIGIILTVFLMGCSSSYKELKKLEKNNLITFQDYLFSEYKIKAIFEADEMHDWNSAKLYSEKALKSLNSDKIYPEKISYWNIPIERVSDINSGYQNLMSIYHNAKTSDPMNLARAIVSLDCWSEQEEEAWQTWDIKKCKQDFLKSMHMIYNKLTQDIKKNYKEESKKTNIAKDEVTIVTKNKNDQIMQIIYFDFDKEKLSKVSEDAIKKFLSKNHNKINEYIVVGHTDTKGSKQYNYNLSIKRAEVVRDLLIKNKIKLSQIKILGKGEESLAIVTPDNTKHPANRRVEIKKSN